MRTRQAAAGRLADESVSAALRAQVRTEVAREFFRAEHGRDPIDAREIAATIAKQSRPRTQTVAGYDLTFSPVKSVSTLWAVADPQVAAQIERAHQAAVQDALSFVERHALFTRQGRNGVRQVNVRGLVTTAFIHRDSRAGDPDLHTHVAVANKVQTLDGRWLSIDGRVLFKATVAASETYNTALEHHLRDRLGVRFADRPDTELGKRPVREIVGVEPALNQRWSTRRVLIKDRQGELAARFQRDHGRPPTPVEALQLAQQATLETRDAKHEPRTLTEQRSAWHTQAAESTRRTRRDSDHDQRSSQPQLGAEPCRGRGMGHGERGESAGGGGGTPFDLAKLACPCRSATPGPGHTGSNRQSRAAGRAARRRGAAHTVGVPNSPGRQHQRAGGVASDRRFECLHGCRIRVVHLTPDSGRRAATRRHRGPHRRTRRGRRHCWNSPCWNQPPTGTP